MKAKLESYAQAAFRYAKIVWAVPAVKSRVLTWLIRASVPGAAVLIPVIDALVNQ